MSKKVLAITQIESERKNNYVYDASTNLIFPDLDGFLEIVKNYYNYSKEQIVIRLSKKYDKRNVLNNFHYIDSLINKYNAFYFNKDRIENSVIKSEEELENNLANLNHIILEVSQACNLRCRYCIYSGNYKDYRRHSKTLMKPEIAFESVNKFINFVRSEKRILKHGKVFINFYGGEPLLNFALIQKVVEYVKTNFNNMNKVKEEIYFSISSNGTLLNDEIINFLVKHNIMLAISLDGPQEEHDKNRVKISGEGSFDEVWKNIVRLTELFPEYYRSNVIFLQTLNPNHNLVNIKEFYNGPFIDRFSKIKTSFIRDNDIRYQIKRKEEYLKMKKEYYCNKANNKNNFLDSLSQTFFDKINKKQFLGRRSQFTSACQPDNFRLFVSVDGAYHLCERINSSFSIGDYKTGIQFAKMKKTYENYNEKVIRDRCCWCKAKNFCSLCIASLASGNGFDVDEPCNEQQKIMHGILKDTIYIYENNPNYFNRFAKKSAGILNEVFY